MSRELNERDSEAIRREIREGTPNTPERIETIERAGQVHRRAGVRDYPIDWRALFVKYVGCVGEAEGVAFLYRREWATEEWREIMAALGLPESTEIQ